MIDSQPHEVWIRRWGRIGEHPWWAIYCVTHDGVCTTQGLDKSVRYGTVTEAIARIIHTLNGRDLDIQAVRWRATQIAHGRKVLALGPLVIRTTRHDGTITMRMEHA